MIRDIKTYPHKALKQKAKPVARVNDEIKKLINDMVETLYANKGAGLAANQVGELKRIIVVDPGDGLLVLVNPKIVSQKGKTLAAEGCLSLPGYEIYVKRPEKITVEYLDRNGREQKLKTQDLRARVICHEIDHLQGKTLLDKLPFVKRILTKSRLRKAKNKKQ